MSSDKPRAAACLTLAALCAALEKTDKRLLLSANKEPAILLRDPKLTIEEMLRTAVSLLEKVEAELDSLKAEIDN